MKHPALTVLKALLLGRTVQATAELSFKLIDNELCCVMGDETALSEMKFDDFLLLCGKFSSDEIFIMNAENALTDMNRKKRRA